MTILIPADPALSRATIIAGHEAIEDQAPLPNAVTNRSPFEQAHPVLTLVDRTPDRPRRTTFLHGACQAVLDAPIYSTTCTRDAASVV